MKRNTLFLVFMFSLLLMLFLSGNSGTAAPVPPRQHASSSNLEKLPLTTMPIPTSNWDIQPVDAPSQFTNMEDRGLVLDASGYPHIAYGSDHLYYAWHDGTRWHYEVVDPAPLVGEYASLQLDTLGYPHISYYDAKNGDLKYAHFDGAAWQTEIADSVGDVGSYNSLVLDAVGRPHISYLVSWDICDLRYAYFDGSSWITETVDSEGWVGLSSSLALDSNGYPHISYYEFGEHQLKYARYDGATWHIEIVASQLPSWGESTSLVLDAFDYPHISYFGYESYISLLKYAYFDGTEWIKQTCLLYTSPSPRD